MRNVIAEIPLQGASVICTFTLPGAPVPKGRPRSRIARKRTGEQFIQVYTDSKTQAGEKAIKQMARLAMRSREPFDGPVSMKVAALIPIPPSWTKSKRQNAANGLIFPTSGADIDNHIKLVMDACNEIVYVDDKQVVAIEGGKRYSREPRLEVEIEQFA